MEGLILRISFIISSVYVVISFFKGYDYHSYLLSSIYMFIGISIVLLILQYAVLKILAQAKMKLLEEHLSEIYEQIKTFRKKIQEDNDS